MWILRWPFKLLKKMSLSWSRFFQLNHCLVVYHVGHIRIMTFKGDIFREKSATDKKKTWELLASATNWCVWLPKYASEFLYSHLLFIFICHKSNIAKCGNSRVQFGKRHLCCLQIMSIISASWCLSVFVVFSSQWTFALLRSSRFPPIR